jgi:ABC-type branched-subunit amino acid transport system substrate-binding protein/predicted Ser/Thr protein kinase
MTTVPCPHCGKVLDVTDARPGETRACPACGRPVPVGQSVPAAIGGAAPLVVQLGGSDEKKPDSAVAPDSVIATRAGVAHPETPTPPIEGASKSASGTAYAFLEPAREPGELGWLVHYRVVRLLGQGGMGLVFQAVDTQLERPVALKVMKPDLAQNAASRQRFVREARAMAAVRSEHIVTIHQVGEANGVVFMAMELLPGEPLDDWLAHGQRASVAQILDLGLQCAKALDAAHRSGLIHRDIKPANIWLEEATGRVKILDFGLARPEHEDTHLTQTGMIVGTPAYMAPEQAEGLLVDARCDLYALGCVLYELATGRPPFEGTTTLAVLRAAALTEPEPPAKLNPAVPAPLADLVLRLLAKNPKDRPQSATAVIEALKEIASGRSTTERALASGASFRHTAGPGRSRAPMLLGGLAALVCVGVAGFLAARSGFFSRDGGGRLPAAAGTASAAKPAKARSTAQGVTEEQVLIGMTAPFSGQARELGRDMKLGIETYFDYVNDEGGVAGRRLELVALDDGYEPERALANIVELNERRKVFATLGNVGTPTAEKTLPYSLSKQRLFFGAFTGASLLRRDPPDRYVFNYRASYSEETEAMLRYLVELRKVKPTEVAVFAQQDGYGDAGFYGVARALRKYGVDPDKCLRVGHQRNTTDIAAAADGILGHPEIRAVVMVSTYRPAARLIRKVRDARPNMIFTNVSFVGSTALADELAQLGPNYAEGVIVTQVVPPIDSESSAVIQYRERLAKYHPNERPGFVSLEGYLAAAVLVEGLRAAGDELTTDRLVEKLEAIRNLDLGLGAPINFGPSEHQGLHKVWGTILDKSGQYKVLALE